MLVYDAKSKTVTISHKKAPVIIHVNSHTIKSNKKNGENKPPISIRHGRGKVVHYTHKVQCLGPVTFIYGPDKPLSCGAQLWAETEYTIVCD